MRPLSVASVALVFDVLGKAVTGVAHAAVHGLHEGEEVRKPFFEFRGKRGKARGLGEGLHQAELVDGKLGALATGLVEEGLLENFEALRPFQNALQLFFVQQVALAEEVLRWQAKADGNFFVEPEAKLLFVVRIRGAAILLFETTILLLK